MLQFLSHEAAFEEDDVTNVTLKDINLDEMINDFSAAYNSAQSMALRLGELNKDIVEYLSGQAMTKAAIK